MKRIMKKGFSLFLMLVMVFGTASVGLVAFQAAAQESYAVGDIIEFGSYPQTRVTDSALISKLNKQVGESWRSLEYYSGSGYGLDGEVADGSMVASDYMKYADIIYNGTKYRGITFSKYRPTYTGGLPGNNSRVYKNGYYTGTVYWFRYEPLLWRILDPSSGLVMCDSIIDSQAFNNYVVYDFDNYATWGDPERSFLANDYSKSSIRTWLNDTFFNTAFSYSQRTNIITTVLNNSSPSMNVQSTSDKVFLLSYDEVKKSNYGFSMDEGADSTRQAKGSDYAKCQGLYVSNNGYSIWRLRSPGYLSFKYCSAYVVLDNGEVFVEQYDVSMTFMGICPAIRLKELKSECPKFYYGHNDAFYSDDFTFYNVEKYISEKPSTEYDPRMAAFAATMANAAGFRDTLRETYVQLGITPEHYETYCYDIADYSWGQITTAFSIADQRMADGKDLIYITCRGTRDPGSWFVRDYINKDTLSLEWWEDVINDRLGKLEWIDDILNLGIALDNDGTSRHGGFQSCANYVLEKLDGYLEQHRIQKNNAVFVITGHSRGAATANIVTADLMDNESVQKKSIYCYTIACPDVAALDVKDWSDEKAKYNNIFNINNIKDPVTYLPGAIGSLVNQTWNTLPNLIETIKNPFGNNAKLIEWDKYGTSQWFSWDWNDDSQKSIDPMSHDQYYYWLYLKTLGTDFKDRNASQAIASWVSELIGNVFTWHCPVDIEITDPTGKMIASVIDGEINYYDSKVGDVLIFTNGDQKAIYIAKDKAYNVQMTGTDTGTMDMEVLQINPYSGKINTDNYSTYTDVPLTNGKTMTASVPKKALPQEIAFFVVNENGQKTEQLQPDSAVVPTVKIRNYVPSRTVPYYTTVVFAAETDNLTEDAQVNWYINGKRARSNRDTYDEFAATDDFTVQVKIERGDQVLAESEVENVHIRTRFFDMLFALFRILIHKPRVVIQ